MTNDFTAMGVLFQLAGGSVGLALSTAVLLGTST